MVIVVVMIDNDVDGEIIAMIVAVVAVIMMVVIMIIRTLTMRTRGDDDGILQ